MAQRCTVCDHPERAAIDRTIITRSMSNRAIARHFGISHHAVSRHARNHLADARDEVARQLRQAVAFDVVSRLRGIASDTQQVLDDAMEGERKDPRVALAAIAEGRQQIELQAKLTRELPTEGTTVTVVEHPDWVELRGRIVTALAAHPEARAAVLTAIEEARREQHAA